MKLTNTRDYQIGVQLRSIHIFFPESGFCVYFESEMKEVDMPLSYEQDITMWSPEWSSIGLASFRGGYSPTGQRTRKIIIVALQTEEFSFRKLSRSYQIR